MGAEDPIHQLCPGVAETARGNEPVTVDDCQGVDIHVVQRLLGHSNITTPTRYLHLSDTDLAEAVNRAFPST